MPGHVKSVTQVNLGCSITLLNKDNLKNEKRKPIFKMYKYGEVLLIHSLKLFLLKYA